jgi:hypothetical protein
MGRKGGCVGDSGVGKMWIALCLASGQQADVPSDKFSLLGMFLTRRF